MPLGQQAAGTYTDPQDYWQGGSSGAGYSEMGDQSMQGYTPFNESLAMGRDFSTPDFQNAPWAGGPTQDLDYGEINPWEGGTAPRGKESWNGGRALAGFGGASLALSGLAGVPALAFGGLIGGLFGKGKKRGHVNRTDPAYQGYQFEPEEGFPAYYEQAQQYNPGEKNLGDTGFQYQQPAQQGYDYDYGGGGGSGVAQPSGALGDAGQNYVGQQEQEYGSFYNQDKGGIYDTFTV